MPIAEPDVEVPEGNYAKGQKLFKAKCQACHAVVKGIAASGPNLNGILSGSYPSAGDPKHTYSSALGKAGFTWTDKHMWAFLDNPKKHIPGNQMQFAGAKKAKEKSDLIEFLRQSNA